jgi:hypothetical protein
MSDDISQISLLKPELRYRPPLRGLRGIADHEVKRAGRGLAET